MNAQDKVNNLNNILTILFQKLKSAMKITFETETGKEFLHPIVICRL